MFRVDLFLLDNFCLGGSLQPAKGCPVRGEGRKELLAYLEIHGGHRRLVAAGKSAFVGITSECLQLLLRV